MLNQSQPVAGYTELQDRGGGWADPEALRAAFASRGVVLLRNHLNPEAVWQMREQYFSRFDSAFLAPGTSARAGVFSGKAEAALRYGMAGTPAWDFVRSPAFLSFVDQDRLSHVARLLLEGPVKRVRRTPLRHFYPGSGVTTAVHRDREYMDVKLGKTVTIWIPLGDCTAEMGGIAYLEQSHDLDYRSLRALVPCVDGKPKALTQDWAAIANATRLNWASASYKAGDILVHDSDILHCAWPSTSMTMRLSTDIRFIRDATACDDRWSADWAADDGY